LAPFFETLECLSYFTGYRNAEKEELYPIVDADIAFYRLSKGLPVASNVDITAYIKKKN
jgi:hypothetical protein